MKVSSRLHPSIFCCLVCEEAFIKNKYTGSEHNTQPEAVFFPTSVKIPT